MNETATLTAPTKKPITTNLYDVIVVGAGPAGMTAGVYLARKKLKTLILSRDIGGQAALSSDIENYLGFSMIAGGDLVTKFEKHLEEFKDDVELHLTNSGVQSIVSTGEYFTLTTGDQHSFSGRAVIITGGRLPRELGVPGEKEFLNRGVTYCAWCDGPIFKGRDIAIIGGGNSALDAALNVQKIVGEIYIINQAKELTGDAVMIDKLKAAANVRVINNAEVKSINGDKMVNHITITDHTSGLDKEIPVAGVFIEIGSVPATKYLANLLKLNESGEIEVDAANMTNVSGIFAAGDITSVPEKQIVVAAGEGAKAAIQVSQYLAKK